MNTEWMDQAACRSHDPELFFPAGNIGKALPKLRQALSVCGQCPVRRDCLEFAFRTGQEYGVWGGASEEDRGALRRRKPHTSIKNRTA